MIVASLAIVAVSRLMMGDPGSLLFALRKLVSYGISPDRIIAQLERESISSITDLLRCTDDDLRAAGLKIKEISLIREKRPLIAGELRSTSGSVSPTASGAMGRPGTDDDQEGLGVMLQQEREERRREADAFQSQLVEQTRELQRVVSHLNSTSQEASNQAEISQLRAELEHERAVKNADLERTRYVLRARGN
ncbi:hypothetical protein DIPPA_11971 [Diplonema papillatum]|nr:hypothetical protein DIPPA_11971 [Diplonema papillatum]